MVAPKIVSAPDPPASYAADGVQRGHPGGPLRRHTAPSGWMAPCWGTRSAGPARAL